MRAEEGAGSVEMETRKIRELQEWEEEEEAEWWLENSVKWRRVEHIVSQVGEKYGHDAAYPSPALWRHGVERSEVRGQPGKQ